MNQEVNSYSQPARVQLVANKVKDESNSVYIICTIQDRKDHFMEVLQWGNLGYQIAEACSLGGSI